MLDSKQLCTFLMENLLCKTYAVARKRQVLRKPDAIALTEAFSRRGGAAPVLRSGGQAGTGGAPAAPAAASAAASVGQVREAHRPPPRQRTHLFHAVHSAACCSCPDLNLARISTPTLESTIL